MNSFLLDTNFIFSLVVESDSNHTKAWRLYEDLLQENKLIIPLLVIGELSISGHKIDFIKFCRTLADTTPGITMQDIKYIGRIKPSKRKSLKVIDCLLLALAHRHNAKLITFDKRLAKV